eukprot:1178343-Prorocentrum_minimum.AAC.6
MMAWVVRLWPWQRGAQTVRNRSNSSSSALRSSERASSLKLYVLIAVRDGRWVTRSLCEQPKLPSGSFGARASPMALDFGASAPTDGSDGIGGAEVAVAGERVRVRVRVRSRRGGEGMVSGCDSAGLAGLARSSCLCISRTRRTGICKADASSAESWRRSATCCADCALNQERIERCEGGQCMRLCTKASTCGTEHQLARAALGGPVVLGASRTYRREPVVL